jgi:hypothetical protein
MYKTIAKPIWSYGVQLWGPISRVLQTPIIKEEIRRYSSQYSAHSNGLVSSEPHGATRQQTIAETPAK